MSAFGQQSNQELGFKHGIRGDNSDDLCDPGFCNVTLRMAYIRYESGANSLGCR